MHIDVQRVRSSYSKYKTYVANSAHTVRTLLDCQSTRATLEARYVQCTDIVTAQFVCGVTSVFVANCWLVGTGRGSANRCLNRRSVLYTKAGAV